MPALPLLLLVVAQAEPRGAIEQDPKASTFPYVTSTGSLAAASTPNPGPVHVVGGLLGLTSDYFRGYAEEVRGAMLGLQLLTAFEVHQGTGLLGDVTLSFASGNTLTSSPDPSVQDPKPWYESDNAVGLAFDIQRHAAIGLTYTIYTSPNGRFATGQEIALAAALDDTALLGAFALRPSVKAVVETTGARSFYGEVGIGPSIRLPFPDGSLTLLAPLTLGGGLPGYYPAPVEGAAAYFAYGLVLTVPFVVIPDEYGAWTLLGSLEGLVLDAELAAVPPGPPRTSPMWATLGLSFAY